MRVGMPDNRTKNAAQSGQEAIMGRSVIVRPSGLAVIDAVGSSGDMRLLQGLPRFCLGAAARSLRAGGNAQMVDLMRLEAGTETVIDVHH